MSTTGEVRVTAARGAQQSSQRRWPILPLQIALTVLAVAVLVRSIDLSAAWQRASQQDLTLLMVAMGFLLLQVLFGAMRWHSIRMRLGGRISFSDTLQLFYISIFFNSCLWGAVSGDVLRAWLSYQNELDAKTAVTTVALDKVSAVAGVAILVLLSTPVMIARLGSGAPFLVPAGVAVFGLVGIVAAAQFERFPSAWRSIRLVRVLQAIGDGARRVFFDPAAAVATLGFALLGQLALGVAAFAVANSLRIETSILDCIALLQPVALVAALPISVGGWGVRETTMIMLFGLIGVAPSAALALSVQLGILSLAVALPGGVVWLLWRANGRTISPRLN